MLCVVKFSFIPRKNYNKFPKIQSTQKMDLEIFSSISAEIQEKRVSIYSQKKEIFFQKKALLDIQTLLIDIEERWVDEIQSIDQNLNLDLGGKADAKTNRDNLYRATMDDTRKSIAEFKSQLQESQKNAFQ